MWAGDGTGVTVGEATVAVPPATLQLPLRALSCQLRLPVTALVSRLRQKPLRHFVSGWGAISHFRPRVWKTLRVDWRS